MKKEIIPIFASLSFVTCSNANNAGNDISADSISVDSVADNSGLGDNEQSENHYAIWQMDSTNEVNYTTYDLAAMEVRGHVKKIVWDKVGNVARYDKDGYMMSYSDEHDEYQLGRNDDGCLTIYACGAGSSTFSIDPETNRIVCYSGGEGGYSWTNFYHYDKNGNLVDIEYNNEDITDNSKDSETLRVKVLEKDSHGNWTKRKVGENIEKRVITYYSNALEDSKDEEVNEFRPLMGDYSFMGTIGNDNKCVLTFSRGEGTCSLATGERLVNIDSYNPVNGKFVISARLKSGTYIGKYEGVYSDGVYSGVFTNVNGGKVNFKLKRL